MRDKVSTPAWPVRGRLIVHQEGCCVYRTLCIQCVSPGKWWVRVCPVACEIWACVESFFFLLRTRVCTCVFLLALSLSQVWAHGVVRSTRYSGNRYVGPCHSVSVFVSTGWSGLTRTRTRSRSRRNGSSRFVFFVERTPSAVAIGSVFVVLR